MKNAADLVVDTTNMAPRRLREEVFHNFESIDATHTFHVEVMSFGFKYGLPLDADIVMDVRFFCQTPIMKPVCGLKRGWINQLKLM